MKVRAQIAMVMNLDKCIGCHTCSVTCKNVWTSRSGMEYAWWNNVETKPGIGYPKDWENQEKWKGGWERKAGGGLRLKQGSKLGVLLKIFANPHLPEIDDYYEPFTFDYDFVQTAPEMQTSPVARPVSILTQKRMEKIEWGPNWEEILGGEFSKRSKDYNFADVEKEIYGEFENTFMITLPRICEHCLNPACVASCPSGSIYKREEDGIVLIDQDKCRGWRMCVSGCPYKKIYYNWTTGKAEKCIFCYPRIEAGQPTVCSETCVGRIRYLGVMLYDADGITHAASVENPQDLYQAQLDIFLDPDDPAVQAQARADGVPEKWLEAARRSPAYKMAIDWKIAFPLHPEYRTLPMVWYVPPLSPINARVSSGKLNEVDGLPDVRSLRIPVRYLANLLTAGKEEPVILALERLLAMRAFFRERQLEGTDNVAMLERVGLSEAQAHEMHRYLAIANYEDRFVIPTTHREYAEDAYDLRNECGFSFGNGCSSEAEPSMFGGKMGGKRVFPIHVRGADGRGRLAQLVADLGRTDRLLLEERYVNLFDRGRTTSLHLFEHVHGESRDRGPAMVDLLQVYENAGLVLAPGELPDYLPAVLEYLSCRPLAETREMLGDCAHIVRKVGETLAQRGSHYAAVLAAVLVVAAEPGLDWGRAAEPPPPEPPIDEEWADTPAFAPPVAEAASPAVIRFMPRPPDPATEVSHKGTLS